MEASRSSLDLMSAFQVACIAAAQRIRMTSGGDMTKD